MLGVVLTVVATGAGVETGVRSATYLCGVTFGLFLGISLAVNLPGLGAGELRVFVDDVSDLAGDGLARIGTSNLAGLAEFDGIVMGLSRGDDDDV